MASIFKQPHRIGKYQFQFSMHAVKLPVGKTYFREQKRAAFKLWKAKVPLKEIRSQLQMSEATLRRILTVARNKDDSCPDCKAGRGKKSKVSEEHDGVHAEELQEVTDKERGGQPSTKMYHYE